MEAETISGMQPINPKRLESGGESMTLVTHMREGTYEGALLEVTFGNRGIMTGARLAVSQVMDLVAFIEQAFEVAGPKAHLGILNVVLPAKPKDNPESQEVSSPSPSGDVLFSASLPDVHFDDLGPDKLLVLSAATETGGVTMFLGAAFVGALHQYAHGFVHEVASKAPEVPTGEA